MSKSIFFTFSIILSSFLFLSSPIHATDYYVATNGNDTNPGTQQQPWKTLTHAFEAVPEGNHTISLGKGTFYASKTLFLKSGWRLVGQGTDATNGTTISNTQDFEIDETLDLCTFNKNNGKNYVHKNNFLLYVPGKRKDLRFENLRIVSNPEKQIFGGLFIYDSDVVSVSNVHVEDFRFSGIYADRCDDITISNSVFRDATTGKFCRVFSGQVRTIYMKNFELNNCHFYFSTPEKGYGYKGSGHENGLIHDNVFHRTEGYDSPAERWQGFDLESAHELEYGLQIYDNNFTREISVPKDGKRQGNLKGYAYTVRIYDNRFEGGIGIEGPRGYLVIDHNYMTLKYNTAEPRRFFNVHNTGTKTGPTHIYHNVVEAGMGFLYKKNSTGDNLHANYYIYNNTVRLFNSDRHNFPTSFLEIGGNVENWQVKNNIVIASEATAPDKPSRFSRGNLPASGITIEKNLAIGVGDLDKIPEGNFIEEHDLNMEGTKPFPYYAPKDEKSFLIDKGAEADFLPDFAGSAPDLGAYEFLGPSNILPADESVEQVAIYPNPFDAKIQVSMPNPSQRILKVRVTNTMGGEVSSNYSISGNSSQKAVEIDFSNLASGLYFLFLDTEEDTIVRRIIKK